MIIDEDFFFALIVNDSLLLNKLSHYLQPYQPHNYFFLKNSTVVLAVATRSGGGAVWCYRGVHQPHVLLTYCFVHSSFTNLKLYYMKD